MTAKELANLIDGRQYLEEMTNKEENIAKENGLVVVFGASDDLIDHGVIVPPVKVGDTVYSFVGCFGVVLPFFVEQIIIDYDEKEPLITICANCHNDENDELLADIDFEYKDIGVTVFLTREGAEAALKEREQK